MKKQLMKITFSLVLSAFVILFVSNIYAVGKIGLGINKGSTYVGDNFVVTISGINGKVEILSNSNVSLNVSGTQWVEGSMSITGTAMSLGRGVVTVKPVDVSTSSANPEEIKTPSSVEINVQERQQPTSQSNNNNQTNTQTSTNASTINNTVSREDTNNNSSKKSSNAYLSKLQINQEGLTPNFNKNKTSYAVTVGENVNDLKVTAVAEDSKSKVAISGNTGLKNGDNKVYITVTAQDGTKKVYTITVTKTGDPVKSNSYLQNLIVENATMSPEFSKEILEYDCGTVGASVENLKILAFGENENVKIDITGNDKLSEGDNKIIVKVTSEDGTTTKEYVITVKKDSSIVEENNIEEINALQDTDNDDNFFNKLFKSIKNNWLVCLMYILILVQFIEIVYLYKNQNVRSHKKVKEDNNIIEKNLNSDELKKSKRMSLDKEFKQNKKKRKTSENLDGGFPKKRNGANKFFDDK